MHSLFEPFFFLTNTIDEAKRLCDSRTIPASSSSLRCCFTASLSLGCMGLGHSLKCFSLFNLIWFFTAVVWPCDMSSRTKISGMDLSFSRIRSGMGESSRLNVWLSLFGSFRLVRFRVWRDSSGETCWAAQAWATVGNWIPSPVLWFWPGTRKTTQDRTLIPSILYSPCTREMCIARKPSADQKGSPWICYIYTAFRVPQSASAYPMWLVLCVVCPIIHAQFQSKHLPIRLSVSTLFSLHMPSLTICVGDLYMNSPCTLSFTV